MDFQKNISNNPADYDILEPKAGHRERFARRLSNRKAEKNHKRKLWIAAAVLILFLGGGIGGYQKFVEAEQAALVQPEIKKTQDYFAEIIQREIKIIQAEETPESKKLVSETMYQLKKLEKDYKKLLKDFMRNNENKTLINAMIENFRQRIQLLEFTKEQLEEIKKAKNTNYEQGQI